MAALSGSQTKAPGFAGGYLLEPMINWSLVGWMKDVSRYGLVISLPILGFGGTVKKFMMEK